ncbi:hypothetical protein [Bradyrhizobium sp. cf659]|uniref:hypothetical protein n=1 Tax=Bradyrhizobium sp. cf659 TaxID=1761771 RepID=UPI0008E4C519|nr:hypothetical protein [Bradyrhizobium sp. cf659]SFH82446.1 hypothetical protein SAMN04487925_101660 [Bradyrhizobium sp. cf659]
MAVAALKSAKREFVVPSLSEASPQYAKLLTRRNELQAQRATTDAEIRRLVTALQSTPRELHRTKIAELLGDQVPHGAEPAPSREQLNELRQHLSAIDEAVSLIETRIAQERIKASAVVCDQVQDEHRRRVRDICFKLIELREAMLAYSQLVDTFNDEDIAWSRLLPSQLLALGNPRDRQSEAALYLRAAVKSGFLDQNEVPEAVR